MANKFVKVSDYHNLFYPYIILMIISSEIKFILYFADQKGYFSIPANINGGVKKKTKPYKTQGI